MIVKVSVLVAASFAAFAVSQINSNSTRKQNTLVELQDGALMESEKVEEKDEEKANSDDEDKENKLRGSKVLKNVTEDEKLIISDLASEIEQRKVYLQGKLLELYGLKEEKQYLAKLQTHLEEKSEEIGILNVTLASLQCEKESLKEETKQGALAKKNIEVAKKMIVEIERKMAVNERRVKSRVSMIEDRVCGFRGDESSPGDALIEKKLNALRSLELEAGKTKRRNKELQLEKRALTINLVAAQDKITAHVTEDQVMDKIEDETSALKHNNEDLSREIEKLHEDRFEMVEELVYQRWLNICLRFEAQNKDNPLAQTSKNDNLNNNSELTNSEEKIKCPTSYPSSLYSFSSLTSSTESDPVETTTFGSSSTESSQNSSRKSSSFMRRVIRWRSGCKDDSIVTSLAEKRKSPTSKGGLVRRFSTSMVPESSSSMRRNKGLDENVIATSPFVKNKEQYGFAKSSEKLSCNTLRVRRVSFSDHLVKKVGDDDDDVPSIRSVDRVLGHQSDEKSSHMLNSTGFEGNENSEEKSESGVNGGVSIDDKRLENIEGDVIKNEMIGFLKEKKVKEDQLVHYLFALLGFLLFIFLAYMLHTTTRFL